MASPPRAFAEDEKVGGSDSNAVARVSQLAVEPYRTAAAAVAARAVAEGLNTLLPCDPAADSESACAREFVQRLGLRAWRRPLTLDEQTRLVAAYDTIRAEGSFEDAIRVVFSAMLQSPNFLYHIEVGEPVAGVDGIVALTDAFRSGIAAELLRLGLDARSRTASRVRERCMRLESGIATVSATSCPGSCGESRAHTRPESHRARRAGADRPVPWR